MSQNSKPETKSTGEKAEREARLAQALRTNLRRRKAAPAAAAKTDSAKQGDESPAE